MVILKKVLFFLFTCMKKKEKNFFIWLEPIFNFAAKLKNYTNMFGYKICFGLYFTVIVGYCSLLLKIIDKK